MEIYRRAGIEADIRARDLIDDRSADIGRMKNPANCEVSWLGISWSDTTDHSPTRRGHLRSGSARADPSCPRRAARRRRALQHRARERHAVVTALESIAPWTCDTPSSRADLQQESSRAIDGVVMEH
jgi:hypothetical protein